VKLTERVFPINKLFR